MHYEYWEKSLSYCYYHHFGFLTVYWFLPFFSTSKTCCTPGKTSDAFWLWCLCCYGVSSSSPFQVLGSKGRSFTVCSEKYNQIFKVSDTFRQVSSTLLLFLLLLFPFAYMTTTAKHLFLLWNTPCPRTKSAALLKPLDSWVSPGSPCSSWQLR